MRKITGILLVLCIISSGAVLAGESELFNEGRGHANKGDYDRALDSFREAVTLNPGYNAAWIAMAVVYINKKMYSDAIDSLRNVSNNANAYYLLAMVYEEINDSFGAVQAWNSYLDIQPGGSRANIAREHLRRLEGK